MAAESDLEVGKLVLGSLLPLLALLVGSLNGLQGLLPPSQALLLPLFFLHDQLLVAAVWTAMHQPSWVPVTPPSGMIS